MSKERSGAVVELESLSNEMFSPLSEREASLVVGGVAAAADVYVSGDPCVYIAFDPSGITIGEDLIVQDIIVVF